MATALSNVLPLQVLKQEFEALFGPNNSYSYSNLSESVSKFKS